jgi:hypothetical protein
MADHTVTFANGTVIRLTDGEISAIERLARKNGTHPDRPMDKANWVQRTTLHNLIRKGVLRQDGQGRLYFAEGLVNETDPTEDFALPVPKPAKAVHLPAIRRLVRELMEPQGHKRANMPVHGGWAVSRTAWDMKTVAMVHWAYDGTEEDGTPSNMVTRPRSEEIRQIGEMLKERGYELRNFREDLNHFFVVPEGV